MQVSFTRLKKEVPECDRLLGKYLQNFSKSSLIADTIEEL